MSDGFATPQDAEDAFYDALDESDPASMHAVWEDSDEVFCLLPMAAPSMGADAVRKSWAPLLHGEPRIDIEVRHLHWVEGDPLAIHLVEEHISVAGQHQKQPPIYATNVYRKGPGGWRMIMHQNSPSPPAPGAIPPGMTLGPA